MPIGQTNRRAFIAGLGGAAVWPLVARAQQGPMPIVGLIDLHAPNRAVDYGGYGAFIRGLSEAGFVDQRNVIIDHRDASDVDQLPTIAGDFVRKKVAVISGPANAIVAAKAETTAIPMVFIGAADPVAVGLVSSFNRPGGNVTGVLFTAGDLPAKQIEIIHDLVPKTTKVGLLINPRFTTSEPQVAAASAAADAVGITVTVERVVAETEFEVAFEHFAQRRVDAILAIANIFFVLHRDRLAELALARGLPFLSQSREFAMAGGVASYGPNTLDVIRQAGTYVGRILMGENPADLPVQQPTKFDLVINLKTAKALGLAIPPTLLARADEVIE